MMWYFLFLDFYFIILLLIYDMECIFIFDDWIIWWKLSYIDEFKWMFKKSIDLYVDGFFLWYLDIVDVEGINMFVFFNMNSFELMYFVMKWEINY